MQPSPTQCKRQGRKLCRLFISCGEGYPFYRSHIQEQPEAHLHGYGLDPLKLLLCLCFSLDFL